MFYSSRLDHPPCLRKQAHNLQRNRTDSIPGNCVVGKLIAYVSPRTGSYHGDGAGVHGCRIVNARISRGMRCQIAGQVDVTVCIWIHICRRHSVDQRTRQYLAPAFKAEEEECFILPDWTTHRAAKLMFIVEWLLGVLLIQCECI